MSNKRRANSLCPLLDTGPPAGDVWVVRKKAVLPYHIEHVGTGDEGLAKLRSLQAAQRQKDDESRDNRRARAIRAFSTGSGDLTDVLKDAEVDTDPHYSPEDARRQAELHPASPTPSWFSRVWGAVKQAFSSIWTAAQPHD